MDTAARPAARPVHQGADVWTLHELRTRLAALDPVSEAMITRRVAELGKRSWKGDTQVAAIDLAIACIDLTTLEGADTAHRVDRLAAKAVRPDPFDPTCPSVAAVCVYPSRVADVRAALDAAGGSAVAVASVAAGFPAGLTPLASRRIEIEKAVADGASEIDTVIDRAAMLAGDVRAVYDRVRAEKAACGPAHLKVILEVAELGDLRTVYEAAFLAMWAGADVIKTSTGKGPGGATFESAYTLCLAARRGAAELGRPIGVKIAGGVRTAKDAYKHLTIALDQLGVSALDPAHYRIGASALLDDLVAQRRFHATGRYHGPEFFPIG